MRCSHGRTNCEIHRTGRWADDKPQLTRADVVLCRPPDGTPEIVGSISTWHVVHRATGAVLAVTARDDTELTGGDGARHLWHYWLSEVVDGQLVADRDRDGDGDRYMTRGEAVDAILLDCYRFECVDGVWSER